MNNHSENIGITTMKNSDTTAVMLINLDYGDREIGHILYRVPVGFLSLAMGAAHVARREWENREWENDDANLNRTTPDNLIERKLNAANIPFEILTYDEITVYV